MTNTVQMIFNAVKDPITPENEELFFNGLCDHLYLIGYDSDEASELINNLYIQFRDLQSYQKSTDGANIQEIQKYLNKLYLEEIEPRTGLDSYNGWLNNTVGEKRCRKIKSKIENALSGKSSNKGAIRFVIDTNHIILLNPSSRRILSQSLKITQSGKDISTTSVVINAFPEELIIHDSPLDDEGRTFTIKWVSHNGVDKPFFTKQYTISEIETYLTDSGYVTTPHLLKGALAGAIQALIDADMATIKHEIETPGFYHDNETTVKVINYDYNTPSRLELMDAFTVLKQLVQFFKGREEKLATILKWGWLAPFSYMKKQIGEFQPYLYLHGKTGSGKTTAGQIIIYLWNTPSEDNDIGGGSFDTPARMGKHLSTSTFPFIVNEPAGMFNKANCVEILKNSVEKTSARGRYEGKAFKTISALAPVIFSSNHYIPSDDALLRRLLVIMFTHNERKTEEEKKDFENTFKIGTKNCTLHALKNISYHILGQIMKDPSILTDDWKKIIDKMLSNVYEEANVSMPEWLKKWSETVTLQDMDDEETESIRMFLLDTINREARNITVNDEDGYRISEEYTFSTSVKSDADFYSRVWNVINERKIAWCFLHHAKNGKNYVCFSAGMKRDLGKNLEFCYDLKSVAELLEWEYKNTKIKGNSIRVMKIEFNKFVEFLYPDLGDES